MESQIGKGLDGLAGVVANKWYAAMGLVGLLLFFTSLVVEIPTDPVVAGCIGLMMMGYGFGQTECRVFQERVGLGYQVKGVYWRLTFSGALLFAISIGAAITLIIRLF